LQRVFEEIVDSFKSMFNRIARIQCSFGNISSFLNLLLWGSDSSDESAGFFVTVDMFQSPPGSTLSDRQYQAPKPADAIRRDCDGIVHSLRMFEDSWHLVNVACNMLLDKVTYADKLTVSENIQKLVLRSAHLFLGDPPRLRCYFENR
jgi:hypothetical protein